MNWKIVGIVSSLFLLGCEADEKVTIYNREKIVTVKQSKLVSKVKTFKPYEYLIITKRSNNKVILLCINPDLEYGVITQGSKIQVIELSKLNEYFHIRETRHK